MHLHQLGSSASVKPDIVGVVYGTVHEMNRAERTRAYSRDGGAEPDLLAELEYSS